MLWTVYRVLIDPSAVLLPSLARKSQYVRQYVWVGDRGRSEGNFLRYSCNRVREANLNASLEGRLRTITRVYLR